MVPSWLRKGAGFPKDGTFVTMYIHRFKRKN